MAALAFLAALFLVDCGLLLAFGWRNFGLIIPMVIGYLFGLLRMRSFANQMAGTTPPSRAVAALRRYYTDGTWKD